MRIEGQHSRPMGESELGLVAGASRGEITFAEATRNFKINTEWWRVFDSFRLKGFDSSPLWLSRTLGVTVEQAVEALAGLEALGLIQKSGSGYVRVREFTDIDNEKLTAAEKIDNHAICAQQVLNHLSPRAKAVFRAASIAAPKDVVIALFERIAKEIEKADMEAKKREVECDGVYLLAFTAVNTLKDNDGGITQ